MVPAHNTTKAWRKAFPVGPHGACPLALLLLTFFASSAMGAQPLSLEQLVTEADLIIKGRVQRIESSGNVSLIGLSVEEQLKGARAFAITIFQPSGSIAGLPSFALGEEAVLFLKATAGQHALVGGRQGKFTVQTGKNTVVDFAGRNLELAAFIGAIKQILKGK